MSERIREHIRSNIYGLVAIFIALGGTTYAANKVDSGDIDRNAVKSKHIGTGQVKSGDVKDDGLTGADIDESALSQVPTAQNAATAQVATTASTAANADRLDDLDSGDFIRSGVGTVGSTAVADNSLTGADIDEGSLDPSTFTLARSASDADGCDPTGGYLDCVGTTLVLPRAGRVLIVGAGGQASNSANGASGDCHLEVDDSTAPIPHSTDAEVGEDTTDNTSVSAANGFATTAVTGVLPAGNHDFELSCDEDDDDTVIDDTTISAMTLGSG